jgi:PiT family inorganic phosphate transporter
VLDVVVMIVAVALVFDFLNGFHDAATSIATVVSTRVLTLLQAVVRSASYHGARASSGLPSRLPSVGGLTYHSVF